ncbi:hypothetical protein ABTX80_18755 [Streptomyces erythrochromogenes]|uniref:hypothetical protein n=1 Tax=Streptomyces erythrochromogenes TaxID=285574 RepID=UPI00332DB87D
MSDEGRPTPARTVVKDTDREAGLPAPDAVGNGTVQSGSWPYTHVECPDPA